MIFYFIAVATCVVGMLCLSQARPFSNKPVLTVVEKRWAILGVAWLVVSIGWFIDARLHGL